MSADIRSSWMEWMVSISSIGERVEVYAYAGPESNGLVNVDRADFLAAVASELNVRIVPAGAIVIERSELPAVMVDGRHGFTAGGLLVDSETTADDAIWAARCHLAVAEYLTANPPVDEEQVSALAEALMVAETAAAGPGPDGPTAHRVALHLVRAGVRVVTS